MLVLAGRFGANGVAAANIGNACFGVVWLAVVCMPRTFVDVGVRRGPYYFLTLIKPAILSAPFIAADVYLSSSGFTALVVRGALVMLATAICFHLFMGTTPGAALASARSAAARLQRRRPSAEVETRNGATFDGPRHLRRSTKER